MKPEARNTLLTALAQQSVNDADSAVWILDKNPEYVCEERMPWDELCNMAHNLAAGFTTLRSAINAVLADPTRNCDVGTAAEHAVRMSKLCDAHGRGFDGHGNYDCENCQLHCGAAAVRGRRREVSKVYRVTGTERLKFSMEIEAESKAEAKRKFDAYISGGAYGWDSVGVSIQAEEIKKGAAK